LWAAAQTQPFDKIHVFEYSIFRTLNMWWCKMKTKPYREEAKLFSALAHPVRLRILDILAKDDACVCHLSAALQQRQSYVSQQLAKLREAGLIVDTKDGLFVYYHLADEGIVQILDEARHMLARMTGNQSFLQSTPSVGSGACPCPKCQAARIASVGQAAPAVTTS
jgi:DNA-binding transcriptional ArsR family regulator